MDIKIEHDSKISVERYVERRLNGDDYGRGALEAAQATADNIASSLGRLLDILASKNLLTALEISKVVEDFDNIDAKFVE